MAGEPMSLTAFVVAGFAATLSWAGGLTKLSYENKGKIAVLEERTQNTDEALEAINKKLDRVVDHLLGNTER